MTMLDAFQTGSEGFTVDMCEELRASGWDVWGAGLAAYDSNRYLQIDLLMPNFAISIKL